MIRAVQIVNPAFAPILRKRKEIQRLKAGARFDFDPGVNFLVGRNGSGKSTLLQMLASYFFCAQGGTPKVTQTSKRAVFPDWNETFDPFDDAVILDHDGQSVEYCDTALSPGLVSGHFDDDFFESGLANAKFRGSHAETRHFRLVPMLQRVLDRKPVKLEWHSRQHDFQDRYRGKLFQKMAVFLAGAGEKGPPTVLLDEPEPNHDPQSQARFWRFIKAAAAETQFIIATHSFFSLGWPSANYIEMSDNALADATDALRELPNFGKELGDMTTIRANYGRATS